MCQKCTLYYLFSFILFSWHNTNGQDIDLNVSEVRSMLLVFSFISINWHNTNGQDMDLNVSKVHSMLLVFFYCD